jgi:hypothetical protein
MNTDSSAQSRGLKPWPKGVSGNPGGRAPIPKDVRDAFRAHTRTALGVLLKVATNPKSPPSARVSAAEAILSRAWGKPYQPADIGKLEGTLSQKGEAVLSALSDQKIAPEEAGTIMQAISAQARIVEVAELERRISELEKKHGR